MRYLITGATGLIGRELVARLRKRKATLHALLRDPSRAPAGVEVIGGDITLSRLAIADVDVLPRFDAVFHLAGHYDLEAAPAMLDRVNVDGTRHLLELLDAIGFDGVLHYVSSVAVAGDHKGDFFEDDLDVGQTHPHAYHRSKFEGEKLVRAHPTVRYRIYRPSAVVGHSKTGAMDRIDGPYYLFAPIKKLRDALPKWFPLYGPEGAPVNMVPVDWVADAIDALAHKRGLDHKTFHLADPDPPSFNETFNMLADAAGAPRMKRSKLGKVLPFLKGGNLSGLQLGTLRFFREQLLDDMDIPRQIGKAINRAVRYDTSHVRAALNGHLRCPRQADYVEPLWDYWLRNLEPSRDPAAQMRRYLTGKHVLITGASAGIGAALARRCAELGAHVIVAARREPELQEQVAHIERCGGSAEYVVADLSNMEACDALTERRVDILFNNAGRSIRRPLSESLDRFHDFERVFQLNFFAAVRLIRGVLPGMRARKSGHIVNILSAGTLMPAPRFGVYTASKAALSQVGDTLAAEHADENIHCTAAYLPFVRTAMMDASGAYDDTGAMTPERAANWILEGVSKRQRRVIQTSVTRRYVMNQIAPALSSRLLSVVYRIYADNPEDHPEFAVDRGLAKRFIKGRLV